VRCPESLEPETFRKQPRKGKSTGGAAREAQPEKSKGWPQGWLPRESGRDPKRKRASTMAAKAVKVTGCMR